MPRSCPSWPRLILDAWGLSSLNAEQRRDLLWFLEYRHDRRFTAVTGHLRMEQWHDIIGNSILPTPSSTAWCTTPTRSNSKENRCANTRPNWHPPPIPSNNTQNPRRYAPTGGSLAVDWVAGFTWNGWQTSVE